MLQKINHIGIAVPNMEVSKKKYIKTLKNSLTKDFYSGAMFDIIQKMKMKKIIEK